MKQTTNEMISDFIEQVNSRIYVIDIVEKMDFLLEHARVLDIRILIRENENKNTLKAKTVAHYLSRKFKSHVSNDVSNTQSGGRIGVRL